MLSHQNNNKTWGDELNNEYICFLMSYCVLIEYTYAPEKLPYRWFFPICLCMYYYVQIRFIIWWWSFKRFEEGKWNYCCKPQESTKCTKGPINEICVRWAIFLMRKNIIIIKFWCGFTQLSGICMDRNKMS